MDVSFKCFSLTTDKFAIVMSFFILQCETISRQLQAVGEFVDKPSSTQPGRQDYWCHRSGFTIAQREQAETYEEKGSVSSSARRDS